MRGKDGGGKKDCERVSGVERRSSKEHTETSIEFLGGMLPRGIKKK